MITRLGPNEFLIDVVFESGGKSVKSPVILDTGASGPIVAYLDSKFAANLGIKTGEIYPVTGIGGTTIGWKGKIDKISISDNPDCALENQEIVMVDLPAFRAQGAGLLGLEFIKRTKMLLEFTPDTVKIGCFGKAPKSVKMLYPRGSGFEMFTALLIQIAALLGFTGVAIYLFFSTLKKPDKA